MKVKYPKDQVLNDFFALQGGFAKCYELQDIDTKEVFAGKIVSKNLLVKQHQKDKVYKVLTGSW